MMMPFPDEGPRDQQPPQPAKTSLDDRLARQVNERLSTVSDFHRHHLRAEVQNGVVLLSGAVDSAEVAESAVELARATDGVRDVCNAIRLPPPRTAAASAGFEAIAAQLVVDHPSLVSPVKMPLTREGRIFLGLIAAFAWGLICVLLVVLLA